MLQIETANTRSYSVENFVSEKSIDLSQDRLRRAWMGWLAADARSRCHSIGSLCSYCSSNRVGLRTVYVKRTSMNLESEFNILNIRSSSWTWNLMRCAGKCMAPSPTSPAHLSITGQEVAFLGRTHVTLIIEIGCCCCNRVTVPLGWTLAL